MINLEKIRSAAIITTQGLDNVKNIIEIKVNNDGSVKNKDDSKLKIIDLGNKGDNCVTALRIELPNHFKSGYNVFLVVEQNDDDVYSQKCLIEEETKNALAWIDDNLTFGSAIVNMALVLIESNIEEGNVFTEQEVFVSNTFMGRIKTNFLYEDWDKLVVTSEETIASEALIAQDQLSEEDPTEYVSMHWVNDETKLNAANMNNIMLGIDSKLSARDLKTINNQSIVGEGNIEIDLSNYYTINETDAKIQELINASVTSVLEEEY